MVKFADPVTGCNILGNNSTLLPAGEWSPLDGAPPPEYIPPAWDGPHVGQRLVEAFKTLSRLPGGGASYKSGLWPDYRNDWEDLLARETADADDRKRDATLQNRARLMPSAEDITRMESAIAWPGRYVTEVIDRRLVQRVAMYRARDLDLDLIARRLRLRPSVLRRANRDALDAVAVGLRRDQVAVF